MIYILYPAGSHGNFLELLLNTLLGIESFEVEKPIYDHVKYKSPSRFVTIHNLSNNIDPGSVINITVQPKSFLKYFAVCLNRTSGHNITDADLCFDTFEKIKKHSILSWFANSLTAISGLTQGNVEPKFIREWIRLCFFANNGRSIAGWLSPSVCATARFKIDFESFYTDKIIADCVKICESLGVADIETSKIHQHLKKFRHNNFYFDIDAQIDEILMGIQNHHCIALNTTNLISQAWIDNYLVNKYNIDPLLKNEYFDNTIDLVQHYNLVKGNV